MKKENTTNRSEKKTKIFWICFSLFALLCVIGIGTIWGVYTGKYYEIADLFYPTQYGKINLEAKSSEWQNMNFFDNDNQTEPSSIDYFEYTTPFISQKITCCFLDIDSQNDIEIRVTDEFGNVVIDPTVMKPGSEISANVLERNVKYKIQCRNGEGLYFFAVS